MYSSFVLVGFNFGPFHCSNTSVNIRTSENSRSHIYNIRKCGRKSTEILCGRNVKNVKVEPVRIKEQTC